MKRNGLPLNDPLRGFDGRGIEFKFSGDRLDDVLDDVAEAEKAEKKARGLVHKVGYLPSPQLQHNNAQPNSIQQDAPRSHW